jgi:hypothetical protein
MSHDIKLVASVFATIIALVAYIPYLIDMFRGKNQPHLYTWISITLITAVIAYLQLIGGAGVGSVPVIIGVGVDIVILFYCFRFGTKDIVLMDKICLIISVVGLICYILLRNQPFISLVIVSIAEVISFVPTIRKTRKDPYSESLTSYYLLLLKLSLVLIALENYNLLTASYPLMWLCVFVLFLGFTYYWRSKTKRKKHTGDTHSPLPV